MSRAGTTRDRQRAPVVEPVPRVLAPLRRRRRASRLQRLLFRAGVLVAALATTAWVLGWGPLLAVQTVRVDGLAADSAGSLTAADIRTAADIPAGTPMLRVDVAAAAGRIAALPQVSGVEVVRSWPNSVVVTVTEREPVAVVESGGVRSLMDADGVAFDTLVGDVPAEVVPLIVARPGPDDAATRAGLAAITELPDRVRTQVGTVAAGSASDVTLTLTDGTVVVWGSAADSAAKADALVAVLAQLADGSLAPAATIDVSAPGSIALR